MTKAEAFAAKGDAIESAQAQHEDSRPEWQEHPDGVPKGCDAVRIDISDAGSLRVWIHSDEEEPTYYISAVSVPSLIAWLREHFE